MLHEDATIGGNDGCNLFNGPATLDGNALTVEPLAATMRFCDMEVSLTGILDGTHAVAVEGDTLTLTDAQGTRWVFSAVG
ncbi:META domain-containing protein [Corynebacterium mastitidis]